MTTNNIATAVVFLGVVCALIAINASKRTDKPLNEFPYPTPDVIDLATKGEKVKAIKMYRKQTSVSLYDANRVISGLSLNNTK